MSGTRRRILGIVVAYHPSADALTTLVEAIAPQVDTLLLVDNTPDGAEGVEAIFRTRGQPPNFRIQSLGRNYGIALAQNVGIRAALEGGYDYVLLSDQDSTPAPDMVSSLEACAESLRAEGVKVGCVCPAYFDETTGQAFCFQVQKPGRLFYSSVPATEADPWIEVVATISSGSLIPCYALESVGGMREEFFIDDVDTEWCHRARSRGFRNYGTAVAKLTHRLGDACFRVWWFGWHSHNTYSTIRLYYRFRNFVLMCRLPHVPLRWCLRATWFWLGNFYAYAIFSEHRMRNLRAMSRGLLDGMLGRSGPRTSRMRVR